MSGEAVPDTSSGVARPRLAVVGTGWWATQQHIPALLDYDGAELVAIVDSNPDKLGAALDHFDLPGFSSIDELLAGPAVDGAIVATSSASHYAVTRQLLQSGVHAMVEKPMTIHAGEAWELVDIARQKDLHLQVGYTHHFTPSAIRLHEAITGGEIGTIIHVSGLYATMVEAFYRGRPEDYRAVLGDDAFGFTGGPTSVTYADPAVGGGGQGHTQVTHLIGMIMWATGLRASEVSAFMEKTDLAVDLVNAIACRFANGALGSVGSTGNMRPNEPLQEEIRYYGTAGFALQDLVTATVELHYGDGRVEAISSSDKPYPPWATSRGFADVIAGRAPNRAPGELGARAVEYLDAAYRSAASGERIDIAKLCAGALG